MRKPVAGLIAVALATAGCSTATKDIVPTQVSPLQYQAYDCEQLAAESIRIHGAASKLGGRLDEAAGTDKTIGWVGGLLFWPALFWLGGTKQQEAEYARLRGEYDAVQQAAIIKKCPGVMRPAPTPTPVIDPSNTNPEPTPVSAPATPSPTTK